MLPQKLCTFAGICCSPILQWWKKLLPAVGGRCFFRNALAPHSIGHISLSLPEGGCPPDTVPLGQSHNPTRRGQEGEWCHSGRCWRGPGFSRLSLPTGLALNCRCKSLGWQQQTTLDYMIWEQGTALVAGPSAALLMITVSLCSE